MCRKQHTEIGGTDTKMFTFTARGFWGALSPFIPVLVGIILKFSLLDKPTTDLPTHFKTTYLSGIWIDFVVTAYIASLAWLLTRREANGKLKGDGSLGVILFTSPAICFVVCVMLTLGFAKAGISNEFLTLYLPAAIAAISVAISGNALAVAG